MIVPTVLALDVDGVLLDPERGGHGHWTDALESRFGITRPQLREAFFMRSWDDVVNGRRPIEEALAESLALIGSVADTEDVLHCWFEADFCVIDDAVDLARRAGERGVRVVLATNQEHRRAAYLRHHLSAVLTLDDVIYSADIGCQKHDPTFFEIGSDRLGIAVDERSTILFVDDVENNVEVARRAGWQAIHAAPDGRWVGDVAAFLGIAD